MKEQKKKSKSVSKKNTTSKKATPRGKVSSNKKTAQKKTTPPKKKATTSKAKTTTQKKQLIKTAKKSESKKITLSLFQNVAKRNCAIQKGSKKHLFSFSRSVFGKNRISSAAKGRSRAPPLSVAEPNGKGVFIGLFPLRCRERSRDRILGTFRYAIPYITTEGF